MIEERSAIFIMPRSSKAWRGAEALWITVAGWSHAAEQKFGDAIVVTRDRLAIPSEVLNYPIIDGSNSGKPNQRERFRWVPGIFKTVIKDLILWKQSKNWKIIDDLDLKKDYKLVWEQHDLFPGPGKILAKKLNIPFVIYVHAPVVWESSKWGVKRYVWGRFLEKLEAKSLRNADLIGVVSEEVKTKIVSMGISSEKVIVSPMAVNPDLFLRKDIAKSLEYSIKDKFVFGWIGSFRSFHGLDHLIKAFQVISKNHEEATLLLVGDGIDREKIEKLVEDLKLERNVIFAGRQAFTDIPKYISAFDVAIVSAKNSEGFHYSPLKLREYLAAGKAVLAPNAGDISRTFQDGTHLKLFEAGNIENLIEGMEFLFSDPDVRMKLAKNGQNFAFKTSTWKVELDKIMDNID